MEARVCVIIPAYNAAATIGRAVASALAQPEVSEVVVADDFSADGTIAAARSADDGSGRLSILALPANRGPSAARNAAIRASRAPFLAILDSDDFLLPGRFARMLAHADWDLIADNILFVPDGMEDTATALPTGNRRRRLTLHEFVERNIPRPGHPRSELGFLKPLIRRTTLEQMGLRYHEDVRLGEDYLFYAEVLAKGGIVALTEACGYVAVERPESLSGRHRTEDLARLMGAARALANHPRIAPADRAILHRHVGSVEAKHAHRRFLDDKARTNVLQATVPLLTRPDLLLGVARAVVRDKVRPPAPVRDPRPRLLFAPEEFDQ